MSRYTKEHYEDVARTLTDFWADSANWSLYCEVPSELVRNFADLFAADNPKTCIHCGYLESAFDLAAGEICDSADGRTRDEHNFEGGFDRAQFLAACGLKGETDDTRSK